MGLKERHKIGFRGAVGDVGDVERVGRVGQVVETARPRRLEAVPRRVGVVQVQPRLNIALRRHLRRTGVRCGVNVIGVVISCRTRLPGSQKESSVR